MRGVGEVCDCPKNLHVFFRCQWMFAVCKIAIGHGDVVDLWYIVCADGLLEGNLGSDSIVVGRRKFCVMGPQCPCGSITKASKAVFACKSSEIVVSPRMGVELIVSILLFRKYFFLSIFWRCFSAAAVYCFCTSAESSRG